MPLSYGVFSRKVLHKPSSYNLILFLKIIMMKKFFAFAIAFVLFAACSHRYRATDAAYKGSVNTNNYTTAPLPPPNATKSVKNFSKVVGWPEGMTQSVP